METENKFTIKPPKGWSRETGTPEEIDFRGQLHTLPAQPTG